MVKGLPFRERNARSSRPRAQGFWPAPPNSAPQVKGHLMQFIDSPNRYGLPPFFELHVWAWKDNPQGPFVDWNNHVSCAHE